MFKALYRKYRPQNFDDIVGQEHIVSVLKNAISHNKVAHAYLFYGPRGTGKTSIAKIFANAVNAHQEYRTDSVDIIEIDAASNNGVDEIRDIKEAIKFLPNESQYKVYIIDEVHMLTTAAFNALLKTLEEPPAHIIFILATTEMHKIPATILSRCQKFEFKNLSLQQLEDRLNYIAKKENITIEKEAVKKISLLAKGGLRDAIGILDQVSNYSNENVKLDDVLEMTSSLSEQDISDFYGLLLSHQTSQALVKYKAFVNLGKDTKLILKDLINIARDITIYKTLNDLDEIQTDLSSIKHLVDKIDVENIYSHIDILSEAENAMRFSTEYESYMQIAIIKLSSTKILPSLDYANHNQQNLSILEDKIKALEAKIESLHSHLTTRHTNKTVNDSTIVEDIEPIEDFIIPNKDKLKTLITNSNDKFRDFAATTLSKIIMNSKANQLPIYELIQDASLVISTKEEAILMIQDKQAIFKLSTNPTYKDYLDKTFSKMLGVTYGVNILQQEQYQYLLKEIEKDDNEAKIIQKENKMKIEELFSEIIEEV